MIRLLTHLPSGGLTLQSFDDDDPPPYAILSHTWTTDQEVTFGELMAGTGKDKSGYAKIEFCVDRAAKDKVQYAWVDTCCIDKSDPVELSTAINSMFRWYQRAAKCYAILSDVRVPAEVTDPGAFRITWDGAFQRSRWFKRGWTLQELLAPPTVDFFCEDGKWLGSKIGLEQEISAITRIPIAALRAQNLSGFSIEERMSWGADRTTKWIEDKVYCLVGILGVFLSPIYGEGEAYATERLKDEIRRRQDGRGTTALQDLAVSSTLPFPKNEHFVGRENQLQSLEQFLVSVGHRRTTVYGLGGCGKSALAIEFVYRAVARGGQLVLWVPAISRESFEQAYREIGLRLRIPGITDDNADIKQLVKTRLSSDGMGQWLLIVDNADDPEVLLGSIGPGSARLYDCIPYSANGKVLFTTRSRKAAGDLTPSSVIELSDMSTDKNEARQLLERLILKPALLSDVKAVGGLLHELTHLPLAIVQAAASMNNNDISASEYLLLFRESGNESEIFGEPFEDHSRYLEMDSTIAKTWHISFDQIQRQDALAAEYLSFMACVDRVSIPRSLLPPSGSRMQQLKAIGTLKGYKFIAERQQQELESEKSFDMHRLVHMASAWWLEGHEEQTAWAGKAAARLEELIPYGGHEGKERWTTYLAHAIYMARAESKLVETVKASLLNRVGHCRASLGQYSLMEITHRQALSLKEKALGEEHSETLDSMNQVGIALNLQAKNEEAVAMHMQTLALRKKMLGAEHPDTLISMNNLALAYSNQGRWKETEELQVLVMETRKRVLGVGHSGTLISMNNLASTYWKQSRLEEAEKLQVLVMEILKRVLGAEHPNTLISMNNLALTYWKRGRWKEAEELQILEIETRKRVLGAEHPETLINMNNLASTYWNQGRLEEAEKLQVPVMEARERVLGAEHPHTLTSMDNLAATYRIQGRLEEAEKLQVPVMEVRKRAFGAEHPDTLTSIANLAVTYSSQGRLKEAEELQVLVLETQKRVFGAENPSTLISISNLASTYSNQGRSEEAEKLQVLEIEAHKKVLGAEHPDTLISINNLVSTYWNQSRLEEAEKLQVPVIETRKRVLGAEHPDTLTSMTNLAFIWKAQGKHEEAIKLITDCIQLQTRVLGVGHPDTVAGSKALLEWRAEDQQPTTKTPDTDNNIS